MNVPADSHLTKWIFFLVFLNRIKICSWLTKLITFDCTWLICNYFPIPVHGAVQLWKSPSIELQAGESFHLCKYGYCNLVSGGIYIGKIPGCVSAFPSQRFCVLSGKQLPTCRGQGYITITDSVIMSQILCHYVTDSVSLLLIPCHYHRFCAFTRPTA